MIVWLALVFFAVGVSSSLIGLGGGTFYLIFMELFRLPIELIPILGLFSNIIVSGIGASIRLLRREPCSRRLLLTILLPSISLTYIGARIHLNEGSYRLLLNLLVLVVLLAWVALQYQIERQQKEAREAADRPSISAVWLACISGAVGLTSGLVGIGGGIVLGPVLYLSGMSYSRIPIITAIYIFLNSIVGLTVKLQLVENLGALQAYWLLPLISALSSVITMYWVTYRVNSNQIKIIVMATIGAVSLYNIIRLVLGF